jgi:galactonate dehydratase
LWIEEPVAAESPAQLARLAEKFVTPIAVGERLVTRWAFREVFERELASIVQPDVANAGGISELVRIAAMAEMYGLAFAPHNPNGPVQSAASLHLAAALQPFAMLEHRHEHHGFMQGLIGASVPSVEEDGCTSLPQGPGLGVAVDEEFARKHAQGSWIPESFRSDGSIGDW